MGLDTSTNNSCYQGNLPHNRNTALAYCSGPTAVQMHAGEPTHGSNIEQRILNFVSSWWQQSVSSITTIILVTLLITHGYSNRLFPTPNTMSERHAHNVLLFFDKSCRHMINIRLHVLKCCSSIMTQQGSSAITVPALPTPCAHTHTSLCIWSSSATACFGNESLDVSVSFNDVPI